MNANEIAALWDSLKKLAKPHYTKTDPGHRWDHIEAVKSAALQMAYKLGCLDVIKEILIAVAYHDIFSTVEDRERHNILASQWILDNRIKFMAKYNLNYNQMLFISYAILEHRATYKRGYSSIVSEVVAAADRGIPKADDLTYFDRSYLYARGQGKNIEQSKYHAIDHIQAKFGVVGKANVPVWYNELFGEVLEKRRHAILSSTVDSYFTESKTASLEKLVNL